MHGCRNEALACSTTKCHSCYQEKATHISYTMISPQRKQYGISIASDAESLLEQQQRWHAAAAAAAVCMQTAEMFRSCLRLVVEPTVPKKLQHTKTMHWGWVAGAKKPCTMCHQQRYRCGRQQSLWESQIQRLSSSCPEGACCASAAICSGWLQCSEAEYAQTMQIVPWSLVMSELYMSVAFLAFSGLHFTVCGPVC